MNLTEVKRQVRDCDDKIYSQSEYVEFREGLRLLESSHTALLGSVKVLLDAYLRRNDGYERPQWLDRVQTAIEEAS